MRITNAKSRLFVQEKIPFQANNLKGVVHTTVYVVYSYNWYPLFAFSFITQKWYENTDKYSVSTSKQKTQCHPRLDTIKMTHEELKEFIDKTRYGVNHEQYNELMEAIV